MTRTVRPTWSSAEILLSAGVLDPHDLQVAQALCLQTGHRFLDVVASLHLVDETLVARTLSRELGIPWVQPSLMTPSEHWLRWIPRFVAEQYMLLPAHVRARGVGKTILYVAMEDPTDEEALRVSARWSGLEVRPLLAARSAIERAIEQWYPPDSSGAARHGPDNRLSQSDPPVGSGRTSGTFMAWGRIPIGVGVLDETG
jgi:hypothetical protein